MQETLTKHTTYSQNKIVSIARQILEALGTIHEYGHVHVGLKPSNIFIGKRVILGDPSLPATLVNVSMDRLSYDYQYLAPEIFRQAPITPQTDFYALGCVLHELAYQCPPFVADSPFELSAMHLSGEIDPFPKTAGFSPSFNELLQQLLQKDPKNRPASALHIQALLDQITQKPMDEDAETPSIISTGFPVSGIEFSVLDLSDNLFKSALDSAVPPPPSPEETNDVEEEAATSFANEVIKEPAKKAKEQPLAVDEPENKTMFIPPAPPNQPAVFEKGDIFSERYEIISPIGQGGMGSVYLALDQKLLRQVALKILHPSVAFQPSFLRRFETEAKVLAGMQHPNIVQVYDMISTQNLICLVIQYVDGGSLSKLIRSTGPLNLPLAIDIMIQALSALDYAHQKQVIHRDIKPQNILLTQLRRALISDFGLAKMTESLSENTQTGITGGTLYYMPPEQMQGLSNVDHRGDLYALGMTFYEMLAGQLPFKKDSSIYDVITTVASESIPPPSTLNPAIPSSLDTYVMKAISKDPKDRIQTAAEMLLSLQIISHALESTSLLEKEQERTSSRSFMRNLWKKWTD